MGKERTRGSAAATGWTRADLVIVDKAAQAFREHVGPGRRFLLAELSDWIVDNMQGGERTAQSAAMTFPILVAMSLRASSRLFWSRVRPDAVPYSLKSEMVSRGDDKLIDFRSIGLTSPKSEAAMVAAWFGSSAFDIGDVKTFLKARVTASTDDGYPGHEAATRILRMGVALGIIEPSAGETFVSAGTLSDLEVQS